MKKKLFVYGSLRPGQYNFNRFNKNGFIKVIEEDVIVEGFAMYSLGSYPGIKRKEDSSIVCTLISLPEREADYIEDMEISAGYEKTTVDYKGESIPIYLYLDEVYERDLVKEGDWNKLHK